MDIREQINWNLKALDTDDVEFIGTSLPWFVRNRERIIEVSTKEGNVYHQVFVALYGLFEKQFIKVKYTLAKDRLSFQNAKSKLKFEAIGLLPIAIRALLIRVMSYFSVRVLDKPSKDEYYVEETDEWKIFEHYEVEEGVIEQLEEIVERDNIPALRDSAICALAIISVNGESVDAEEILKNPGVDSCRRWRFQGKITGRIGRESGNLHLTVPGLGVAVECLQGSLFKNLEDVAIKKETAHGQIWEIEPVELVLVGVDEMDMIDADGLPSKEWLLEIESAILKTYYWGDYPKSQIHSIITELRSADDTFQRYAQASEAYKRRILREYGEGQKVIFDVKAVLGETDAIGGRFGLRRVVGVNNGRIYDFIAAKAQVWYAGKWKSCNIAIDSDKWDMMAAGCYLGEVISLRAKALVVKSCMNEDGRRCEYLDLKWSSIVSKSPSNYATQTVADKLDKRDRRRRYPSAAEIKIEQLRKCRMEQSRFEAEIAGEYGDCVDSYDDVREDMGPWTNWPDRD